MSYVAIHSEGALIPEDILDQIVREELPGQKAADFGFAKGIRLGDEIARAWSDAQDYWRIFRRHAQDLPDGETGASLTRERWMAPLLNHLLGYELTFQAAGTVVGGQTFPISHRTGPGSEWTPVHIAGFREEMDRRPVTGHRRLSPQALVQEYLNRTEEYLWGVVSNGHLLRLLRQTTRTSRPSYVEFDLRSIIDGQRYNEFALFFRLCHRTRLPRPGEDPHRCLLEDYFQKSIEQGGRVRERLRGGVEQALRILGSGFLAHPQNTSLREKIEAGRLTAAEFHRQLLRLIYRLLFLMVAEERKMISPEGPEADRQHRTYQECYSVARLRELAEHVLEESPYGDLWLGLKQSFQLFSDVPGSNPLGIPPLNGELFSSGATRDLNDTHLLNQDLVRAMRHLSLFEQEKVRQRINYAALDVEELGSVYESLLDLEPVVQNAPEGLAFDLRAGTTRKSTGSYYTRPELVAELIKSALVPVLEERLGAASAQEEKERAILRLKVCDPASGSGHFLLAAARRMGRELAKVRTGEEEPTPEEFHLAVRDVIAHCLYAVDKNPLAVDLCKVALWLEGHWTGKPLSFLDHRVKCGDSLVGVLDSAVLKDGIPDEAFNPVTGDNKKVASAFKKRNRKERERKQRRLAFTETVLEHLDDLTEEIGEVAAIAENTPADVKRKAELYQNFHTGALSDRLLRAASVWTAAFFAALTQPDDPAVPTDELLQEYLERPESARPHLVQADVLAAKHTFFHWFLEFPEVFAQGGFDVVLGNPPWERLKLQEEEFFATRDPEIADAANKAARQRMINALPEKNSALAREFAEAKHAAEAASKFARASGRFPLTSVGDINTYALFAELAHSLLKPRGRAGIIVPTGIATDNTTKDFFAAVAGPNTLVSLYDFENAVGLFEGVGHGRFKFCLLTVSGAALAKETSPDFFFYAHHTDDLSDAGRHFTLFADEIALINPNTGTCPIFRSRRDAEITKAIYRRVPVLIIEGPPIENPWGISFARVFDMANDSHLFRTKEELLNEGYVLRGNVFVRAGERYFRLYEAKMMHHFTHRYGDFSTRPEGSEDSELSRIGAERLVDPNFIVQPRYWVSEDEAECRVSYVPPALVTAWRAGDKQLAKQVFCLWAAGLRLSLGDGASADKLLQGASNWSALWDSAASGALEHMSNSATAEAFQKRWPLTVSELIEANATESDFLGLARRLIKQRCPGWFLGFRDIARATDERTAIFSLVPKAGVGHTAPLAFLNRSSTANQAACFLGNANALAFDYVTRQKIGGTHLTYGLLYQLPVLPPNTYQQCEIEFIVPRIVELVYTAWDIKAFADDLWGDSDEDLRNVIRRQFRENKAATGANEFNPPAWAAIVEDGIPLAPFKWDEARRAHIRAELDAYYALLYGLNRKQLRYMLDPADLTRKELDDMLDPWEEVSNPLDPEGYRRRAAESDFPVETFRVLKEKETKLYGEYRTRRLVLEAFDRLAESDHFRDEMPERVSALEPGKPV